MEEKEIKIIQDEMIILAMDSMEVGVTIIDPQGALLYYNNGATKLLDRKPEYIGSDIHRHHKKPVTNEKLDFMLRKFAEGQTEPFYYEAKPYGQVLQVTLSPIRKAGKFVGCVHCVRLKEAFGAQSNKF